MIPCSVSKLGFETQICISESGTWLNAKPCRVRVCFVPELKTFYVIYSISFVCSVTIRPGGCGPAVEKVKVLPVANSKLGQVWNFSCIEIVGQKDLDGQELSSMHIHLSKV